MGRGAFGDGRTLAAHILALQRTVGNRVVTAMLGATASAPPQHVTDEETEPAPFATRRGPCDSGASTSASVGHGFTQHGEGSSSEHTEQLPEQEVETARAEGGSYRSVPAILGRVGLSLVLVAPVVATVFVPEPLSKLTLVGLSAAMATVILLRFRRG